MEDILKSIPNGTQLVLKHTDSKALLAAKLWMSAFVWSTLGIPVQGILMGFGIVSGIGLCIAIALSIISLIEWQTWKGNSYKVFVFTKKSNMSYTANIFMVKTIHYLQYEDFIFRDIASIAKQISLSEKTVAEMLISAIDERQALLQESLSEKEQVSDMLKRKAIELSL